jgi:hypothetical protein
MVMLVVDEISQVGGLTLAAVDSRLRQYRDDQHRPFGGIPMVLFFGDFFQSTPSCRPASSCQHLGTEADRDRTARQST